MNTTRNVLILLLSASASLYAQKKPIAVTDMLRIKRAADVSFSPDGKHALYSVTSIVPDTAKKKEYTYLKQIYLADLSGKAQLLDTGNISSAEYSHSGHAIAFVKSVKGKSQVFFYNTANGAVHQVTDFRYGASGPHWSPDDKRIQFSTDIPLGDYVHDSILNPGKKLPVWSDGRPGIKQNEDLLTDTTHPDPDGDLRAVRAYLYDNAKDKKAKVITHSKFQGETNVSADISLSHIFITDTTHGAVPIELTPGFYNYYAAFFAGNDQLYLTAEVDDNQHPDDIRDAKVYGVHADGTQFKPLLSGKDLQYTIQGLSPSGKYLVYAFSHPKILETEKLYIKDLQQNTPDVLIDFERPKGKIRFTPDEKTIYFVSVHNGGSSLFKTDVKTGKPIKLTSEDEGIYEYAMNGKNILYTKTWINNPSEIFLADLELKNPKAITNLNPWVNERQLSIPQKFTFTNNIGLTVEYWVMKPINFDPHKKYPVLVDMHGGPSAMWGPGEPSMWHEFQFFCANGFGVVYCNPRGSGGYGDKFLQANIRDWGVGPSSDVFTALSKAEAQGWIDTTRRFLSGGSYAGYLTAWIVGHDHRFRAASCQRGVYDFKTFFGEGNAGKMLENYFGGYPYVDSLKGILEEQSPINYVQNITTPLLIFHGESDLRTGVSQSEMLFKSMISLGKQVEYVRHPGASHELVRSGDNRQRIDQMLRTYEFFSRFL